MTLTVFFIDVNPPQKFEFLPHTADLRVRVFGASLEELFQNALAALMTILGNGVRRTDKAKPQTVHVAADSATNLLIDFLSEALYLVNVTKAVYENLEIKKLTETELEGVLSGYSVDGFTEDVKAVTYHGAEVKRSDTGEFRVEIVFDI